MIWLVYKLLSFLSNDLVSYKFSCLVMMSICSGFCGHSPPCHSGHSPKNVIFFLFVQIKQITKVLPSHLVSKFLKNTKMRKTSRFFIEPVRIFRSQGSLEFGVKHLGNPEIKSFFSEHGLWTKLFTIIANIISFVCYLPIFYSDKTNNSSTGRIGSNAQGGWWYRTAGRAGALAFSRGTIQFVFGTVERA